MEGFFAFSLSQRGKTHIDRGVVCQDYSDTFSNEKCAVIAVSDGHGSENFVRSDRGSKFACEAALEAAKDFLSSIVVFKPDMSAIEQNMQSLQENSREYDELHRILCAANQDEIVLQLCKNVLARWNEKVVNDYERDPFSEEEVKGVSEKYRSLYLRGEKQEHAYGATLQLAILTNHYFLAVRNGDGECVMLDKNGKFYTPIPENDSCEANYTTSMCDSAAIEDFRYVLLFEEAQDFPAAVFLGSDGVDNSYTSNEELFSLYRNIARKAINSGTDTMVSDVTSALETITNRGSGDDVSIAGILNMSALPLVSEILEADAKQRRIALEEKRESKRKAQLERERMVLEKRLDQLSGEYKKLQEEILKFDGRIFLSKLKYLEEFEVLKQKHQSLCESIEMTARSLAAVKEIGDDRLVELIGRLESYFSATGPERLATKNNFETDNDSLKNENDKRLKAADLDQESDLLADRTVNGSDEKLAKDV